ncbi:MAG: DNA cytosine methyltransferase [Dehalococcoidia bacterium]|nr:DNA cytosine methyltransferase [Dehalococcoidia bacterium]
MAGRLFVSLFSGAGGLDLGLEEAGWECVFASDVDAAAVESLKTNQGLPLGEGRRLLARATVAQADVRELTAAAVHHLAGLQEGDDVELLAGGPPCQAWSSAGLQRGFADPRGEVAREFVRLAGELRPRWLLIENVRGLLTARGPRGQPGEALEVLRHMLWDVGYQTSVQLLNAADFGVPQRRVRLFVVGFRPGDDPAFPAATHVRAEDGALSLFPRWITLGDALFEGADGPPEPLIRPSLALRLELESLPPGSGLKSPGKAETTRPGGHWGYTQGAFVADPDQPARTVTASSQQDWVRDPAWGLRRLTPRECATLQTFPAAWQPPAKLATAYRLIGNAVPPRLAYHLGANLGRSQLAAPALAADCGPNPLPARLREAVVYTAKEERRNGESRRTAPARRGVARAGP